MLYGFNKNLDQVGIGQIEKLNLVETVDVGEYVSEGKIAGGLMSTSASTGMQLNGYLYGEGSVRIPDGNFRMYGTHKMGFRTGGNSTYPIAIFGEPDVSGDIKHKVSNALRKCKPSISDAGYVGVAFYGTGETQNIAFTWDLNVPKSGKFKYAWTYGSGSNGITVEFQTSENGSSWTTVESATERTQYEINVTDCRYCRVVVSLDSSLSAGTTRAARMWYMYFDEIDYHVRRDAHYYESENEWEINEIKTFEVINNDYRETSTYEASPL